MIATLIQNEFRKYAPRTIESRLSPEDLKLIGDLMITTQDSIAKTQNNDLQKIGRILDLHTGILTKLQKHFDIHVPQQKVHYVTAEDNRQPPSVQIQELLDRVVHNGHVANKLLQNGDFHQAVQGGLIATNKSKHLSDQATQNEDVKMEMGDIQDTVIFTPEELKRKQKYRESREALSGYVRGSHLSMLAAASDYAKKGGRLGKGHTVEASEKLIEHFGVEGMESEIANADQSILTQILAEVKGVKEDVNKLKKDVNNLKENLKDSASVSQAYLAEIYKDVQLNTAIASDTQMLVAGSAVVVAQNLVLSGDIYQQKFEDMINNVSQPLLAAGVNDTPWIKEMFKFFVYGVRQIFWIMVRTIATAVKGGSEIFYLLPAGFQILIIGFVVDQILMEMTGFMLSERIDGYVTQGLGDFKTRVPDVLFKFMQWVCKFVLWVRFVFAPACFLWSPSQLVMTENYMNTDEFWTVLSGIFAFCQQGMTLLSIFGASLIPLSERMKISPVYMALTGGHFVGNAVVAFLGSAVVFGKIKDWMSDLFSLSAVSALFTNWSGYFNSFGPGSWVIWGGENSPTPISENKLSYVQIILKGVETVPTIGQAVERAVLSSMGLSHLVALIVISILMVIMYRADELSFYRSSPLSILRDRLRLADKKLKEYRKNLENAQKRITELSSELDTSQRLQLESTLIHYRKYNEVQMSRQEVDNTLQNMTSREIMENLHTVVFCTEAIEKLENTVTELRKTAAIARAIQNNATPEMIEKVQKNIRLCFDELHPDLRDSYRDQPSALKILELSHIRSRNGLQRYLNLVPPEETRTKSE